jgi:hypothetical protein
MDICVSVDEQLPTFVRSAKLIVSDTCSRFVLNRFILRLFSPKSLAHIQMQRTLTIYFLSQVDELF